MYKKIKDINPDQLLSSDARSTVILLLGAVEGLMSDVEALRQENQALRDENNRLKGGNARPQIKGSVDRNTDISSGGKEKGKELRKRGEKKDKAFLVPMDETVKVLFDKDKLPSDAVFKGFTRYTQQDIEIRRRNRVFLFETWYSPSLGKTLRPPWPEGTASGHYGVGLRSLLNVLRHLSDVTEGTLCGLIKSFGIQISAGTISNLLKREQKWALQEQQDILRAGLNRDVPKQMDTTANRQRGVNKATHIITDPYFTVFHTTDTRTRLDCLSVLQGNPKEGIKLLWHEGLKEPLLRAKLGASHPESLKRLMEHNPCLTISEFDAMMMRDAPEIFKIKKVMSSMREEMALAYYEQQNDFRPVKTLLSDGAPEYLRLSKYHGLCWIHDARHYNILSPKITWNAKQLEEFKGRYWEFYRKILEYTLQSKEYHQKNKGQLIKDFDALFIADTQYDGLNKVIESTVFNKKELLMVLDFPDLPLHNNAAELAARRIVRKRDISLHTWSDWGTQLRDAFLSITQTAFKQNVSAYQYICDRISGRFQLESLAQLIQRKPTATLTF